MALSSWHKINRHTTWPKWSRWMLSVVRCVGAMHPERDKWWRVETWPGVENTQHSVQMVYCRVVHLTPVSLTPKKFSEKEKERHTVNWTEHKTRPTYILSIRDSLQTKRHTQTESKGIEKIFHENGNKTKKKLGQQYLHQTKYTLKQKAIARDKARPRTPFQDIYLKKPKTLFTEINKNKTYSKFFFKKNSFIYPQII